MKGLDLKGTTIGDLFLYTAIGLAVAGFALLFAVYSARTGGSGQLPLRWLGFAGETVILFGYMLGATRPYWKNRRFWLGFIGFLVFHTLGYAVVLTRVEQWPLMWFVFVGFGEWIALAFVLDYLLRPHEREGSLGRRQKHNTSKQIPP